MQVLDLAVLAKQILYGFLVGLLMHIGNDDDPTFDGADGGGARVGLHVVNFG